MDSFHWWSNDLVERVELGLVPHEPSLLKFDCGLLVNTEDSFTESVLHSGN